MNEQEFSQNVVRIAIIAMLLAISVFCEIVIYYWNNVDSGYTQFFYILIISAGVWYQKKAIWVALFLAAMHLSVTFALLQSFTWNSIVTAFMFLCAGILVGLLSEERETYHKEILASKNEIEKKHAALIGYMTEYTLRLKLPVEIVLNNLKDIQSRLSEKTSPVYQDVLDSLAIQIKNTEQILSNLQTINRAVTDGHQDIPEAFKKFLKL